MAQVREVRLVDDLDGSDATETVEFALDGKSYAADLSGENATKLRDALAPFVGVARRSSSVQRRSGRGGPPASSTQSDRAAERAHSRTFPFSSRSAGVPINERGRIPKAVIEQYRSRGRDAGDVRSGTGSSVVTFSGATPTG